MSVVLTKYRVLNAIRCYASYALSRFGSVRIFHGPVFVSVEPAAVCQLKCPACPVGMGESERRKVKGERTMSHDVWQRVLEEIRETALVVQFYFQGEPLLNKDLPQMVTEAHEAGIYTILSTNAQAMTPDLAEALVKSGLDRIIVSMDGLTQATYEAYRVGGSLDKCKAALRYLREAKDQLRGRMTIELQCLRLRTNEREWAQFKHEYKALGADRLVFKTAQLYDYRNGHPLMPSEEQFSRYTMGKDGLFHRKKLRKVCRRVWSGVVITTNGEVLPCCYDKGHQFAYGNIMNAPLKELFGNDKANAFRRAALKEQPSICKECYR